MAAPSSKSNSIKIVICIVALAAAGIILYFQYREPPLPENTPTDKTAAAPAAPGAKDTGKKGPERYVPEADKFQREGGGIKAPGGG